MEKHYFCPKCGLEVSQNPEDVSEDYSWACLSCDEDFYLFELREVKHDDNSRRIKDWTTEKLKKEALVYNDLINGKMPCYGTRDIFHLDNICQELTYRGVGIDTQLTFN